MDEIVGELRQEGRLESRGGFTVDLEQAMHKLAERQLDLPGLYLLKTIQAAVALQALDIDLRIGAAEVRCTATLPADSLPENVQQLLQGPFQEFCSPAMRHLAWAWTALAALEPEWATLSVANCTLRLERGKTSWGSIQTANQLCLQLRRPAGSWWRRLVPTLARRTAEHVMVSRLGAFCPVPLRLDGRSVDASEPRLDNWQRRPLGILTTALYQPLRKDHLVGHRLVFRPSGRVSARPPLLQKAGSVAVNDHEILTGNYLHRPLVYSWKFPDAEPVLVRGSNRPMHIQLDQCYMVGLYTGYVGDEAHYDIERMACLALPTPAVHSHLGPGSRKIPPPQFMPLPQKCLRPPDAQAVPLCWAHLWLPADQGDLPGRVYPCQHGVLLDPVEGDLGHPGVVAVVSADHLRTDLSQLAVVRDEDWDALWTELQAEVREFRLWLARSEGVRLLADLDYLVMSHIQRRLAASP